MLPGFVMRQRKKGMEKGVATNDPEVIKKYKLLRNSIKAKLAKEELNYLCY